MHKTVTGLMVASALALAGCGESQGDRAISGAGIGAAGGALFGAVVPGASPLIGALLGGAGGAAIGALTTKDQIDLGKPVWRRGEPASAANVKGVQSNLAALGYNPGPIDGVAGAQTRNAVSQYQRDNGLAVDGRLTPDLAQNLSAKTQGQQATAPGR